jgi:hypothetical protein
MPRNLLSTASEHSQQSACLDLSARAGDHEGFRPRGRRSHSSHQRDELSLCDTTYALIDLGKDEIRSTRD